MPLPTLTGIARLVADPELKISSTGNAYCQLRLVFQDRRKNDQTGQWEDGDIFWVRGTCFRQLAENAAESLAKGMEVVVSGRIRTEEWTDKQTQEKRQAPSLVIDSIAPSLAFAIARVAKADRSGPGSASGPGGGGQQQRPQQAQQPRQQPQPDPWATSADPPF